MVASGLHFVSEVEYLETERHADHKREYYDGELFAMSGVIEAHTLIAGIW